MWTLRWKWRSNTRNSVVQKKKVKGIIKNVAINTSDSLFFFFSFLLFRLYSVRMLWDTLRFISTLWISFDSHTITHTYTHTLFVAIFHSKRNETISSHEFQQTVQAFTHFIATFIDWPLLRFDSVCTNNFRHTFLNACPLVLQSE